MLMSDGKSEQRSFSQIVDRSRLDRLDGEVLAFISDLHLDGYDNMEIARSLVAVAKIRAEREEWIVEENFYHWLQDTANRYIANMKDLNETIKYGASVHGPS